MNIKIKYKNGVKIIFLGNYLFILAYEPLNVEELYYILWEIVII